MHKTENYKVLKTIVLLNANSETCQRIFLQNVNKIETV
jgi:hypothetical protein